MTDTESFLIFWFHYPKKIGRKAALKAWLRATDKPALELIIQAIDNAKKSEQWRKDGGAYIPHPTTWINQGRWDDVHEVEIEKPKPVLHGPKAYQLAPKIEGEFVAMPDGWLESVIGKIGKSMPN